MRRSTVIGNNTPASCDLIRLDDDNDLIGLPGITQEARMQTPSACGKMPMPISMERKDMSLLSRTPARNGYSPFSGGIMEMRDDPDDLFDERFDCEIRTPEAMSDSEEATVKTLLDSPLTFKQRIVAAREMFRAYENSPSREMDDLFKMIIPTPQSMTRSTSSSGISSRSPDSAVLLDISASPSSAHSEYNLHRQNSLLRRKPEELGSGALAEIARRAQEQERVMMEAGKEALRKIMERRSAGNSPGEKGAVDSSPTMPSRLSFAFSPGTPVTDKTSSIPPPSKIPSPPKSALKTSPKGVAHVNFAPFPTVLNPVVQLSNVPLEPVQKPLVPVSSHGFASKTKPDVEKVDKVPVETAKPAPAAPVIENRGKIQEIVKKPQGNGINAVKGAVIAKPAENPVRNAVCSRSLRMPKLPAETIVKGVTRMSFRDSSQKAANEVKKDGKACGEPLKATHDKKPGSRFSLAPALAESVARLSTPKKPSPKTSPEEKPVNPLDFGSLLRAKTPSPPKKEVVINKKRLSFAPSVFAPKVSASAGKTGVMRGGAKKEAALTENLPWRWNGVKAESVPRPPVVAKSAASRNGSVGSDNENLLIDL